LSFSDKIVASLIKQSNNKNLKVKIAVLQTIAALGNTLKENIDKHFDIILPLIESTKTDT
jgi:hypothetical protein